MNPDFEKLLLETADAAYHLCVHSNQPELFQFILIGMLRRSMSSIGDTAMQGFFDRLQSVRVQAHG